jgi:hypothetical protein
MKATLTATSPLDILTTAAKLGELHALTALAEVLFCSPLQRSHGATPELVHAALHQALLTHHDDVSECVGDLAQHYGDNPDSACARMRWCREVVAGAYHD